LFIRMALLDFILNNKSWFISRNKIVEII
jgi:hypothetical protein